MKRIAIALLLLTALAGCGGAYWSDQFSKATTADEQQAVFRRVPTDGPFSYESVRFLTAFDQEVTNADHGWPMVIDRVVFQWRDGEIVDVNVIVPRVLTDFLWHYDQLAVTYDPDDPVVKGYGVAWSKEFANALTEEEQQVVFSRVPVDGPFSYESVQFFTESGEEVTNADYGWPVIIHRVVFQWRDGVVTEVDVIDTRALIDFLWDYNQMVITYDPSIPPENAIHD